MAARLPIHDALPALREALRRQPNAVLEAPPGAGKSTVVPLALLDEPWAAGRRVLLLEPRRLAAAAVAQRMAQTLGERVGETVGLRMRLDTRVGPRTRLEVITEGLLTRLLQEDPALEGVAAVVFDEFHERSLAADLGLALCLQSQQLLAPTLRLLVMSATLDGTAVARLLGEAPVVRTTGRSFPVELRYTGRGLPALPAADEGLARFLAPAASALRRVVDETEGDILCFLPGAAEIRRLHGLLGEGGLPAGLVVHELYGELDFAMQQAALQPDAAGRRKLVLSTNVAETSLTIEGLRVVADLGLVRRSVFDAATGMSRLVTERVSRASAAQRAGRAGRLGPGVAYRFWGEGAEQSLAPYTPPELCTADLAPLALELAAWGVQDAASLQWLDLPPAAALAQARDLLRRLEAVDAGGVITPAGRAMAGMGLHPRLAHLLWRARPAGQGAFAARLAALLSERDLLRGTRDPDLRTRLEQLRRPGPQVDRQALQRVRRLAQQWAPQGEAAADAGDPTLDNSAGALLAWAFPDRIAQRRGPATGPSAGRYLLANGRGARLDTASTLGSAEYLVALDLDDAEGAEARIRLAAPLTVVQLEAALGHALQDVERFGVDERAGALLARRERRLDALVLATRDMDVAPGRAAAAWLDWLRDQGLERLPWDDATRALLARLRFAAASPMAQGRWPRFTDEALAGELGDWIEPWLDGVTRLAQLQKLDLSAALRSRLDHAQQRELETLAPAHLVVPTGTRVAIDYLDESAPCIEVRLQEVFGLAQTPRIAGGSVPVTLKLLSPARRPVQITRDLGGFWRGSYAEVRKDLRGRYPKHYWPENPLEAEPVRGPRRR
ncbi:MAG: putative ATP-dependent helicase protein [Pseudomonadota bacterium]|jgi:ATP-dependent helicase HrpB